MGPLFIYFYFYYVSKYLSKYLLTLFYSILLYFIFPFLAAQETLPYSDLLFCPPPLPMHLLFYFILFPFHSILFYLSGLAAQETLSIGRERGGGEGWARRPGKPTVQGERDDVTGSQSKCLRSRPPRSFLAAGCGNRSALGGEGTRGFDGAQPTARCCESVQCQRPQRLVRRCWHTDETPLARCIEVGGVDGWSADSPAGGGRWTDDGCMQRVYARSGALLVAASPSRSGQATHSP